MKNDFFYNPRYNQMQHKEYPILLDVDDFKNMSDDELQNLIDSRLNEINLELNKPKTKKEENYLSPDKIKSEFDIMKSKLNMYENFFNFFNRNRTIP
jgi:hypothetical protein